MSTQVILSWLAFSGGLVGILAGLTRQAYLNYSRGETHMTIWLNAPLLFASIFRGLLWLTYGNYLMFSLDVYATMVTAILTCQTFGLFLKPRA